MILLQLHFGLPELPLDVMLLETADDGTHAGSRVQIHFDLLFSGDVIKLHQKILQAWLFDLSQDDLKFKGLARFFELAIGAEEQPGCFGGQVVLGDFGQSRRGEFRMQNKQLQQLDLAGG